MTWPRTSDQVPINVGDAAYGPLFPYGWGLRNRRRSATGSGTRCGTWGPRTVIRRCGRQCGT